MTRQEVFDYVKKKYSTAPDDEVMSLIDLSYELTAVKKKRKKQADE